MSSPSTLYQLIWQTRRLFQRLRSTSDELLQGSGINASQRAVLEFLHQRPSQTVPQIAREKSVSRQHIQTVVNDLLELGLIETVENPAHRRSPLIQMTSIGEELFESTRNTENRLLEAMEKRFSEEDLTTALCALKSIDGYLASGDWRRAKKPELE